MIAIPHGGASDILPLSLHTRPFLPSPETGPSTKNLFDESYTRGEEKGLDIWLSDFDRSLPARWRRTLSPYLEQLKKRSHIEPGIETSEMILGKEDRRVRDLQGSIDGHWQRPQKNPKREEGNKSQQARKDTGFWLS